MFILEFFGVFVVLVVVDFGVFGVFIFGFGDDGFGVFFVGGWCGLFFFDDIWFWLKLMRFGVDVLVSKRFFGVDFEGIIWFGVVFGDWMFYVEVIVYVFCIEFLDGCWWDGVRVWLGGGWFFYLMLVKYWVDGCRRRIGIDKVGVGVGFYVKVCGWFFFK